MADLLEAMAHETAEASRREAEAHTETATATPDEIQFQQDWPDDVLTPPGLVGDVVRWIRDSSGMEQPKFALAAGLTLCGAIVGRGVKDRTGQLTNIFTLAVGGTSAGKNDPLTAIRRIVKALSMGKLISGDPTSDSALEVLIDAFPVRLFLLDEVGHFLTNAKSAGQSNGYLRTVIPSLTRCWSAGVKGYEGKARAKDGSGKWTPPKLIDRPCVCLYGTSAPEVLFDAMTEADFSDGSIPRYIPFISESRPAYVAKAEMSVPDALRVALANALQQLAIPPHGAKNQDGTAADVPLPFKIDETEGAGRLFNVLEGAKHAYLARADAGEREFNLFGKMVENARRVALTVACLRNPASPLVEEIDAAYACKLMFHAVRDMVAVVRERVSTNRTERVKKQLHLIIRRAGRDGITKRDLTRKTPTLRPMERDEALQDLLDAEMIVELHDAGSGAKTITRFKLQ